MNIISWNCRGKFRDKFFSILNHEADIYVIQECEDPRNHPEFSEFYSNFIWYGETSHKGLGIFAKPSISLQKNNWDTYCLRHFVSVKVNGQFDLLGVWACSPYIEEYYIYQTINYDRFTPKIIVVGDFNSNAIWDKQHGKRNHSQVVSELEQLGLVSAYHYTTKELHGKESKHTFCLYKNESKRYHIDYCFVAPERICSFAILDSKEWLSLSDHFPIQIAIKE
jgi:exonuclease III